MRVAGVLNVDVDQVAELFVRREDAEEVVENWRRDEPDGADLLRVAGIELDA